MIKRSKCENKGIVPTEMELVLEYTQQGASHEVSDHLKMEMEMEIPSSSNVKLITECSDTTYTCYEVMKDLIKVSKLPQTLISYSSSQAEIDNADTAEASNRRPNDLSNSVRHREQMFKVCRHCGTLFWVKEDSQVLLEAHGLNITNVVQTLSIHTLRIWPRLRIGIKLVYKYTSSSIDPMIEEIYQEEFVDFAMDSSSSLELAPKKTLLDEA
ncbi:hypothetical protein Tco_0123752 [Tanacetum coccineum]